MSKYRRLKDIFPGKRITRLVATKKVCPLNFRHLLVYSTLRYRASKGASARLISLWTHIERGHTLPPILARLESLGLVIRKRGRWSAQEPSEAIREWFARMEDDQLAYNWILVPSSESPLTVIQAAIVAQIVADDVGDLRIASRLKISKKSVSRFRARYAKDGKLTVQRRWFEDEGQVIRPQQERFSFWKSLGIKSLPIQKACQRCFDQMRLEGLSQADNEGIWRQLVGLVGIDSDEFDAFIWNFQNWFPKQVETYRYNSHGDGLARFLTRQLNAKFPQRDNPAQSALASGSLAGKYVARR